MTRTPDASATVIAKSETIHHGIFGFWSRQLRISLRYKNKDGIIDTNEATFDRAVVGSILHVQTAAPALPTGPQRVAVAVVQAIHGRPWGRSKVVDLAFTPEGHSEPAIAVDEIDGESLPSLVAGGRVNVVYPVANPRLALIEGATRGFRWRDPLGGWGLMVVVLAAMLLLVTLVRLVRRRVARAGAH